jgi:hypothetical protein
MEFTTQTGGNEMNNLSPTGSTYVLYIANEKTEHVTKMNSPAKALKALAAAAGLTLASQNGRYGRTTDGRNVAALTAPWSRTRYADERTTRI